MKTTTITIISAILLAALVTGCTRSESSTAPPVPRSSEPAPSPEQLALGKQQYASRCAFCHGENGSGVTAFVGSYPAANLTDGIWFHGGSRTDLIHTIAKGVPNTPMQGFEGIMTPQEIEAVAAYTQTLARR
ncbi:MAG TPA: c-type cytochrome [Thermoanaerobaculia bacterium]|nr:c-type cytochrome [Thermoanaerobaculia bacterium]